MAFATPLHAAPNDNAAPPMEKKCRDMVGKETTEAQGRAHIGHFQAQRFGDCMMGAPS
jgi:hypothetical protein